MNNCSTSESFLWILMDIYIMEYYYSVGSGQSSCWFLAVYKKTNHCGLNLSIDLENSGKTTLEKWKNLCFYHHLKLRYGSLKLAPPLVPDLVKEASCVIWFLAVFSKTNHCGLNLSIDFGKFRKNYVRKVKQLGFYHHLKLRYGSLKWLLPWCQIWWKRPLVSSGFWSFWVKLFTVESIEQ